MPRIILKEIIAKWRTKGKFPSRLLCGHYYKKIVETTLQGTREADGSYVEIKLLVWRCQFCGEQEFEIVKVVS